MNTVNNISTCLAQQSPASSDNAITMSSSPTDFPVTNAAPRAVLIEQARQWAMKALAQASTITSPERSEECDIGCAVATHNLGEFFEMEGKIEEARQKYTEAQKLAKQMGFREGNTNARAGLARLEEMEKARP
jgi:tetratricopeptide (TPR) repeat protein